MVNKDMISYNSSKSQSTSKAPLLVSNIPPVGNANVINLRQKPMISNSGRVIQMPVDNISNSGYICDITNLYITYQETLAIDAYF